MLLIDTVLYYTIFASVVFIYGIGINTVAEIGIYKMNQVTFFIKVIISIFTSSILTWLVTSRILAPLKLIELYPLIAFFIFVCINTFLEAIIRITTGISSSEFIVSYLILLLSVSESTSLIYTMLICASSFIAFCIIVPFCYTFKDRIKTDGISIDNKYYSLFFIFLGILILIMSSCDIFWFSPGVIK